MNSWEMLRRLAATGRDDPLWRVFLERCRTLIRATAHQHIGGPRRADRGFLDDVAQDVMVRLLCDEGRALSRFAGSHEDTFRGYIQRIAANLMLDRIRSEASRQSFEQSFAPEELWRLEATLLESAAATLGDDPAAGVVERERHEIVEHTLRRIARDSRERALYRLLFRLYFVDGCSIPQIARLRAVALSASSVSRRLNQLKKELRRSAAFCRQQAKLRSGTRGPRRGRPGLRRR